MTFEPRESHGVAGLGVGLGIVDTVVDTVDDTVVDTVDATVVDPHPTSESQASKLKQHLGEIAKNIFRVKLYIIS